MTFERDQLTESGRAQASCSQPLLVERTDEGSVSIDGHRRLAAAACAAGLAEVPVIERTAPRATPRGSPPLAAKHASPRL